MVFNKVSWDIDRRAEGAMRGRIERERRMNIRVVLITADGSTILNTAHIPI